MQSNESTYQLFIFPIRYKTVSFHHQAQYQIKISPFQKSFTTCFIHPIKQLFTKQFQVTTDRNGNIQNVDGYITNLSEFKTNKFQIEYNDQLVKFKTGFISRIKVKNDLCISLKIELIKHLQTSLKPLQQSITKRVSSQTIHINLKSNNNEFNIRRLVFATNQYISFIDLGYQFIMLNNLSINLSGNSEKQLKDVYRREILDRLARYREIAIKTREIISQFQDWQLDNSLFMESKKISLEFEQKIIYQDIPDLDYIGLVFNREEEENYDSNVGLNRYEQQLSKHSKNRKFIDVLTQHYQCQIGDLIVCIKIQGKLIQRNIRALFERLIQLNMTLFTEKSYLIDNNQINMVKKYIEENQKNMRHVGSDSLQNIDFSLQTVISHKQKMRSFSKQLSNIIGLQLKQPFVKIINYPLLQKKNKLNVDHTLNVFIHGYKGNQYDLSKIKSHLNLLLGYNNFYSIKGLNTDKANSQTIYKLGEKAARQLNSHLQISPSYRHINIIGFSLGGLIARAMLPWIQKHKNKLNLLLTIASPHLGIRQIESCVVRAGLCYMRRVIGVQSIRELNSERNEAKSRYLHELAQGKYLQWFKFIVLVGSSTDSYVPAYSSLVQYRGEDEITLEMFHRLGQKLKRAVRCVAQIEYNPTLLELLTKRRSHICFLEQDSFIKYLIVKFQDLFLYDS